MAMYNAGGFQAFYDALIGALVGLAKTCTAHMKTDKTDLVITKGLWMLGESPRVLRQVRELSEKKKYSFNYAEEEKRLCSFLNDMIHWVHVEKQNVAPDCETCPSPCGNTEDCDMALVYDEPEKIRSLKLEILDILIRWAAVHNEPVPFPVEDETADATAQISGTDQQMRLVYRGLCVIGYDMTIERLTKAYNDIREIEADE